METFAAYLYRLCVKIIMGAFLVICGATLVFDGGLPTISQDVHIDEHSSNTRISVADSGNEVFFSDGRVTSCKVDRSGYQSLHDGDVVTVRSSRLTNQCVRLFHGDDLMVKSRWWKLRDLGGGVLCFLIFIGVIFGNAEIGLSDLPDLLELLAAIANSF